MIKYLLEKEFKQLLRNPMLPRMLLVFPCIILLVLPWAANFEIKNMNLSIGVIIKSSRPTFTKA